MFQQVFPDEILDLLELFQIPGRIRHRRKLEVFHLKDPFAKNLCFKSTCLQKGFEGLRHPLWNENRTTFTPDEMRKKIGDQMVITVHVGRDTKMILSTQVFRRLPFRNALSDA